MEKMVRTMLVAALVALGLVCGTASTSWAQQSGDQQPRDLSEEQDEEVARQVLNLIREGNEAFDNENYEEAFARYQEAYEMYPDPAILVRMGRTAVELDRPREAIDYYEEFIRLMPDDPTSEKLQTRIAELRAELPVPVTVTSDPAGAAVYLDSERNDPVGQTPVEIELEPGNHTLYLDRSGFESATRQIEIEPGDEPVVSVTLDRTPIAESEGSAVAAGANTALQSDGFAYDTVGWSAVGVGGALLATSGVFYLLKESAEDDVNNYDKRAPGASREKLADLKDDGETYYDISLLTGIVGGALAVTGAGLLTYHYMSAEPPDSVSWQLDAGFDAKSAWLGVNGRF